MVPVPAAYRECASQHWLPIPRRTITLSTTTGAALPRVAALSHAKKLLFSAHFLVEGKTAGFVPTKKGDSGAGPFPYTHPTHRVRELGL